jgi:hypothetical protein
VRWALAGFGIICMYVLMRASSFHKLDAFLGLGLDSFNAGGLLEVTGILTVLIAALSYKPKLQTNARVNPVAPGTLP